jgi:SAM-dependent methyltransferase
VLPKEQIGRLQILEFGCGAAYGAQYLRQLGNLTTTDIYRSPLLELPPGTAFRIADIHQTDFENNQFDILVSNSVLQYLDFERAFKEMKRIGKQNAYYAFSVPTATWLVLAMPAKVFKKLGNICARARSRLQDQTVPASSVSVSEAQPGDMKRNWFGKFALGGHGRYGRFFEAFRGLRVRNWRRILLSHGFEIIRETPLLAYSDSELPMIPPNRFLTKLGLASSYLFVCTKMDGGK